MRAFAIALLLAAAAGVARAEDDAGDEDGEFIPVPKLSVAIAVGGQTGRIGGESVGGFGTSLELALGRDRWQYFLEGSFATANMASESAGMDVTGRLISGGLGLRWLARQFRPDRSGGVELFLLSRAGMQRYYLDDDTRLSRPELAFGFGVQVRTYKRRFGFRLDVRALFTPNDSESALVSCNGRCMAEMGSSTGFSTTIGFVW